MKIELKVGDKVTVRSDLTTDSKVKCGWNSRMDKYKGKECEITSIDGDVFRLEHDTEWSFSINMFTCWRDIIESILDKHLKWLRGEEDGERADLSGADLSDADLRRADLSGADLSGADLSDADLSDADLRRADLSGADLSGADLSDADLRRADLSGADLSGADLRRADLSGVEYNETTSFFALQCPEEGEFIGFKKARVDGLSAIVKLKIHESAKRSSSTSRKCRCSKAEVLSIESIERDVKYEEAYSGYDSDFIYKVGECVEVESFDEDRWDECSTGIHFFITRKEAENY